MQQSQILVFDEVITGGTVSYTSAALNDRLGMHDQIAICTVIDNVSGGPTNFDLFVEHSCDNRNWLQRNDLSQTSPPPGTVNTGDIIYNSSTNTPALTPNATFARMFSDPCKDRSNGAIAAGPLLTYVRFALKLWSATAHVKVYVVQRDL
jgi:hypothetical protein